MQTHQSFSTCETFSFQGLYRSIGKTSPFKNANTFRAYLETRFNDVRKEQAELLKTTNTVSISFDGWSAGNRKHILGAIAYWIDSNWERQSINVEFANMPGKSGQEMAKILYASLNTTLEVDSYEEDENGNLFERKTVAIGLGIAHKVFAICGDNASPNDTFCDHYHDLLQLDYDNDPTSEASGYCFKGRESRIRCLAHIIALIAGSVFKHMGGGSTKEAKDLIIEAWRYGGSFPENCRVLSVYMKVRMIAIWTADSDERVAAWAAISSRRVPADVETRWNSLYLMMAEARKQRQNIQKFAARFPEIRYLVPTNDDWRLCEQVERTLQPFYNLTLDNSTSATHLNTYLHTVWVLVDLVRSVQAGEDQYQDIVDELKTAFKFAEDLLEKYTSDINETMMVFAAHVLDPRCKFTLIKEQYGDQADEYITRIKDYLRCNWLATTPSPSNEPSSSFAIRQVTSIQDISMWERARRLNMEAQEVNQDEWDRYFNAPCETNFDAKEFDFHLKWWKAHEFNFPTVAKAARTLFSVPGSEVDCERLFSGGRDLLGVRRKVMGTTSMRICQLLKSWYDSKDKKLVDQESIAKARWNAKYQVRDWIYRSSSLLTI